MPGLLTTVFALMGFTCGMAAGPAMDRMPAKWFCDYDETPDERHQPPRLSCRQRVFCAVVTATLFALLYLRFGVGIKTIALCLFSLTMVMIAMSDLKYCIIPDEFIIAGCIFSVAAAMPHILAAQGLINKLNPVFGAFIGAGIILAINLLGRLFYKKDALGMGDLKLMVVCGIACGAGGTLIALAIGIIAAAVFFAVGMALKRIRQGDYLPLGPFLVFGTVFTLCFRPLVDRLLAWYISLII
jgi:leader peptidase (prepilin peptidase)/N-methyltransferase